MDLAKIIRGENNLISALRNLKSNPNPQIPLLSAKIKPLWQCNLSCEFCELPKPSKPMTTDVINIILGDLKKCGTKKIHYSGGEIFLYPEIMEILKTSSGMDFQVNLSTNGTLLNKNIIKELFSIKIHSVSLSLDSGDPNLHDKLRGRKGSFKQTINILKLFSEYQKKEPKLIINTVLSNKNINTLDALHNELLNINNKISWNLFPIDPKRKRSLLSAEQISYLTDKCGDWVLLKNFIPPRTPESAHLFSKGKYAMGYFKNHLCYAVWLQVFIDPLGFVYPCCKSRGRIPSFGKLENENYNDIFFGKASGEFKMNMAGGNIPDFCHYCDDFLRECIDIEKVISL